jgi:hypothetical protein
MLWDLAILLFAGTYRWTWLVRVRVFLKAGFADSASAKPARAQFAARTIDKAPHNQKNEPSPAFESPPAIPHVTDLGL